MTKVSQGSVQLIGNSVQHLLNIESQSFRAGKIFRTFKKIFMENFKYIKKQAGWYSEPHNANSATVT